MREIAAEWFERPLQELTPDVSYNLPEWGISSLEEYESLHRFAVTERGLFKTAPMIPGARRCLRLLSNEGARIRIITRRLQIRYFHALAVTQTTDWLDANGIPYWDLCFMKGKEQVGATSARLSATTVAEWRSHSFTALSSVMRPSSRRSEPKYSSSLTSGSRKSVTTTGS
jgi:hypothetical protein